MLYKARVISNSEFAQTGKIRVRIFKNTMPELWKDLSFIPDSIKNGITKIKNDYGFKIKSKEDEAYVFSMYGGGNDYGFFALPQPNSLGVVETIETDTGDKKIEYVWLGAVSFPNGRNINVPSCSEKDKNGIERGGSSISSNGFVIKTKNTNYLNYNTVKPDDLDFSKKAFTNLIAVNENGMEFYFRSIANTKDGPAVRGTSKLLLNKSGLSGEFRPYKDNMPDIDTYSKFYIKPDGEIEIQRFKKDQSNCSIKMGSAVNNLTQKEIGVINLAVTGEKTTSELRMQDDSIEAAIDGNTIQLVAKGNNGEKGGIRLTAAEGADISLSGSLVNLGTAGKSVVLVDSALADATGGQGFSGDGVTFFASGTVKG